MADIYYVDLEYSSLVSDAKVYEITSPLDGDHSAGATDIKVIDGSIFESNKKINISGTEYTIDSISDNTITISDDDGLAADVSSGTAVNEVNNGVLKLDKTLILASGSKFTLLGDEYTVDSVDGTTVTITEQLKKDIPTETRLYFNDDDLDGTSPDKAKRNSIFMDGEDSSTAIIVYVRRNEKFTLTAATAGSKYASIISWPSEGQYGYDDRPQDGIDAGWDDDIDNSGIDVKTFYIYYDKVYDSEDVLANFKNITNDVDTTHSMIYKKGKSFLIINSDIINSADNSSHYSVVEFRGNGEGENFIVFENCNISSKKAPIILADNIDMTFSKKVIFKNVVAVAYRIAYFYRNSDDTHSPLEITFDNSNFNVLEYGIIYGGRNIRFTTYVINILSSTIKIAKDFYYYVTSDSHFSCGNPSFNIIDSTIEVGGRFVKLYSRNQSGSSCVISTPSLFKSSKIKCGIDMFYAWSDYNYIYIDGPITVEKCEIDVGESIFYFSSIRRFKELNFKDNKIVSAKRLLYTNQSSHTGNSIIDIDNGEFTDYLISGGSNYTGRLRNMKVTGYLTDSRVNNEGFFCSNIEVEKISGQGVYDIVDSTIYKDADEDPFPNCRVSARRCNISTEGSQLCVNNKNSAMFFDCNIRADMRVPRQNRLSIFQSLVNGDSISFFETDKYNTKELSYISRDGSTSSSIRVSAVSSGQAGYAMFDDLNYIKRDVDNRLKLYLVIANKYLGIEDDIVTYVSFLDENGKRKIFEGTLVEDTESTWSGLSEYHTKCYIDFDLTDDHSYEITAGKRISVCFDYSEPAGSNVTFYFDTNIEGKE